MDTLKKNILLTFSIFIFGCFGQDATIFNDTNRIIHIQGYGLEEKTTLDLIKNLSLDTNTIVIVERMRLLTLRIPVGERHVFWDWEEPLCAEQFNNLYDLVNRNNIYGFYKSEAARLPYDYFSAFDPSFVEELRIEFKLDPSYKNLVENIDSISRIELCNRLVQEYNLNSLDSLLLLKQAFGQWLLTENNLVEIDCIKKIVYIHDDHCILAGLANYIEFSRSDNVCYFAIARRGTKPYPWYHSSFKIRNRLSKNLVQFQIIDNRKIPRKIKFSKLQGKFDSKELYSTQFIYFDNIQNCVW